MFKQGMKRDLPRGKSTLSFFSCSLLFGILSFVQSRPLWADLTWMP
jgi:hypothetical protein